MSVLTARVCGALQRRGSPDWECTAVGDPAPPGVFTFYTRIASAAAATVEHRWYLDGRLHQTMHLRVPPGGSHGFRTYSRTTVSAERAGRWRVEVRSPDGAVLAESHFAVAR
jgi:hypothetical protein